MKPILDFSKEVYQREMKEYPGLNDQTIISIPRSGLVQKYLTFTRVIRGRFTAGVDIFLRRTAQTRRLGSGLHYRRTIYRQ